MNRMDEYTALLAELEQTPEALSDTVSKALDRKNALQKKRRILRTSLGGFAACFAAFVLLVNLSMPFARACGRIPVLSALAKAVSWSPSLSAAVENDYVQPMELSQFQNGITARVEYLIVDRKQVDVFFSIASDEYQHLDLDHPKLTVPGEQGGYSTALSSYGVENGDLIDFQINFVDRDVPDHLTMTFGVYDEKDQYDESGAPIPEQAFGDYGDELLSDSQKEKHEILATFTFELEFDPTYTAKGTVINVGETFLLDGQSVTLTEAEIYPTHLRLNFDYDPANTAWLTELNFYLENERGERFNGIVNGISATGNPDDPLHGFPSGWTVPISPQGTPDPPCHRGFLDQQGTGAGEGRSGKGHDREPAPGRPTGMGGEAKCRLGGVFQRRVSLGENDALPDLEKLLL